MFKHMKYTLNLIVPFLCLPFLWVLLCCSSGFFFPPLLLERQLDFLLFASLRRKAKNTQEALFLSRQFSLLHQGGKKDKKMLERKILSHQERINSLPSNLGSSTLPN